MQRSIISNEKVSYLYLGVLLENRWMSFFHSTTVVPKVTCLLPKSQQKLTTFSDLVEEGLSYLQLFLELPESS